MPRKPNPERWNAKLKEEQAATEVSPSPLAFFVMYVVFCCFRRSVGSAVVAFQVLASSMVGLRHAF